MACVSSSLRPSVQCVCRAPPHPEDGDWTAVQGPLTWGRLPACTHLGLGLSRPLYVWRSRAAADGEGWQLQSRVAVSRAFTQVGLGVLQTLFFVGKWQLWEGGLIRLYGHQGDGGWWGTVLIAGLWGQQDRNAYNTPLPVLLLLSESATPGCISAHVRSLASSILLTLFHFW